MSNWKKDKLSNLCYRIGDGLHGTPNYIEQGNIYFINGNNIKNGKIIIDENTKTVSEEEMAQHYISLNEYSLLLSINGTLGNVAFYNNEKVILGKSAAYLNFKSKINKFYYYYFQLPSIQKYFHDVATGSTIKNLSLRSLQEFNVPVPSENEYIKIVAVLSTLDDKIEINNRINTELEQMAKTLYDYWFVQFDFPNEEGKPYRASGGEMVYNDVLKREIPAGWEVKKLSEIVTVTDGTHDSPKYVESGFPLITSKNLKKSGIDYSELNLISEKDFNNINKRSEVNNGDILFSMIGNIGTIYKVEEKNINFAIKNVALFKTSEKPMFKNYIYQYLHSYDMNRYIPNVTSGSIQKFIGLNSLRRTPILYNDKIINAYNNKTYSIYKRIRINIEQNQQLASLRDWLLPMLMNGQVTVGE